MRDSALHFRQGKTGNWVAIALVGELGQIVRNHLEQTVVRETFVHSLDGSAYSLTGIGGMLRRYCKKADVNTFGLVHLRPKAIADVYQDTSGDLLAVMALSGHKTERQALAYVRQHLPVIAQPNGRAMVVITMAG